MPLERGCQYDNLLGLWPLTLQHPPGRGDHVRLSSTMDVITVAEDRESSTNDLKESTCIERKPSPWIITAALEEFETPSKDRINTSASGSMLIRFRSPAAHRLQMRTTSSAIWFPEKLCAGFAEAFSFMTSRAPTTPSLAIALDASSLIQIGQEHRDERMVLEGQRMYCDALKLLRMGLARPARERSDALLGAITVLQVAEANMVMLGADWRKHTEGVAAFMQERKDDGKRSHFGWPRLVERNFATFQFWWALIARRRMGSFLLDDAPALLLTAQAVPGKLQDCDEVLHVSFSEDRAIGVLRNLKDLEAELADWTTQWNRCMREAPFQLVSSNTLPFPRRRPAASKEKTAFPLVFRFNDLSDCLDHSICTASMLAIKRAMLDLRRVVSRQACSSLLDAELPSTQSVTASINACADTLCMGIPYLCESKHGKFGKVVSVSPLGLAMTWYRHLRDEKGSKQAAQKLAWCRDAAASIEQSGIRMLE